MSNKYYEDLQEEIHDTRKKIKAKYSDYDPSTDGTYDHGYLDGTLAGLKIARALWHKNKPKEGVRGD